MKPTRIAQTLPAILRQRSLALCVAAACAHPIAGAADPKPSSQVRLVTSCADSGAGSLRDTLAAAVDGDTIDLRELACSRITLTTGALTIDQGSDHQPVTTIELIGPGRTALILDGSYLDRVVVHAAGSSAMLTVSGITLLHGLSGGDGGCLHAGGSVTLRDVAIKECTAGHVATAADGTGGVPAGTAARRGGGIYAQGTTALEASIVTDNKVLGRAGEALGAGIYSRGDLLLTGTTVSNNYAQSDDASAQGGGVFVGEREGGLLSTLSAIDSRLTNNAAKSACLDCKVLGGGAWVAGNSTFLRSQLGGNTVFSDESVGSGGGLYFRTLPGHPPVSATLTDTDVASNSADRDGGAISANGDLVIVRGRIGGNSADSDGGAIFLEAGRLDISNSTLNGNLSMGNGGAIFAAAGSVVVTNTTVSGNIAIGQGAGLANLDADVVFANSTVAFNFTVGNGGGILFFNASPLTLQSTIVAANEGAGDVEDIWMPTMTVGGANNLVEHTGGDGILPGDTLTSDPLLLPLTNNGGSTLTHALDDGSPAIDAGNNAVGLSTDQRGKGYARVFGPSADIGAVEQGPAEHIFGDGFDGE